MAGPLGPLREALAASRYSRLGPRRRYAVDAFAGQVLFAAVTFAAAVLAARLFGPEGKGELTAWTLATGLGGLALAGSIPTGFARLYLAGEAVDLPRSSMRHAGLALGAVVLLAVPALLFGLDPLGVACFVLVGATATVIVEDVAAVLVAAKRPRAIVAIRTLRSLVLAAGLAIGALGGADLDLAFLLWAVGSLASALAALAYARGLGAGEPAGLGRSWRLGHGSAISRLATFAVRRLDQLIVAAIAGLPALGLYNAAVNVSEVTEYAGGAIGHSVFEGERTLDDAAARRILRHSVRLLAVMSVVVTAAGFVLIAPVFGDEFEPARWVLLLLAPGLVLRGPAIAGGQIMLARGRGRVLARIMVVTVAFGMALWTAGTLAWGIEGTAAASSLVYALQAGLVRGALLGGAGAQA